MHKMENERSPEEVSAETDTYKNDFDFDDHLITLEELCMKLNTDLCMGLTQSRAAVRLERFGKNLMTTNKRFYEFCRLLRSLSGVAILYWIVAIHCALVVIVCKIVYDEICPKNIALLCLSVFHAICIGSYLYYQVRKGKTCRIHYKEYFETEVIRDGRRTTIPNEEVVIGDLILMKFGEKIPADVRLVESQNFKVDNFYLTGTHDLQLLHEKVNESNALEVSNVAFFTSTAVEGTARGIVIRTGRQTLYARAFAARGEDLRLTCPITAKVAGCLNKSAIIAIIFAIITYMVFWLSAKGRKVTDPSTMSILALISLVPEEIFRAVMIGFALHKRKLTSESCVIASIYGLEKIPFVNIVCLNKQGILTLNKGFVSNLWFDKRRVEVWGGLKIAWKYKINSTFRKLARCAILCTDAKLSPDEKHVQISKRHIMGASSEAAILRFFAVNIGKKLEVLQENYPKLYWMPYNAANKFQVSVHKTEEENSLLVIQIGEPQVLLEKCESFHMNGVNIPINDAFKRDIDRACVTFAKQGEIIQCVIEQTIIHEAEDFDSHQLKIPLTGYTFIGLIALLDMPRPNLAQTVAKFKKAGIKVILATSDHPITAKTFARQIGVISQKSITAEEKAEGDGDGETREVNAIVVDGFHKGKLSVRTMESMIAKYPEVVFARVSPLQRLMLVASCQQNDAVVAAVGDGIHDFLTLRRADVSITLSETKSSQQKADVYITDDTLDSLATCLLEGRTIYENLKKSSAYALASYVAIFFALTAYCVLAIPLPVEPMGFVLLELTLKLFPLIALFFEKSDSMTTVKPPRDIADPLWSRQLIFYSCAQIGVIEAFACLFTYFAIMMEFGWSPIALIGIRDEWDSIFVTDLEDRHGQRWTYEARKNLESLCQTGYLYTLVVVQCANIFVCRNQRQSFLSLKERNWAIHFSILFQMALLFFFIYLQKVNEFAGLKPLRPVWWLLVVPYFSFIMLYDEIKKWIVRRYPRSWMARETIY